MKVDNFRRSKNKLGYTYLLTAKGLREKIIITKKFLEIREKQYHDLQREIRKLRKEIDAATSGM